MCSPDLQNRKVLKQSQSGRSAEFVVCHINSFPSVKRKICTGERHAKTARVEGKEWVK